MRKPHEGLAWLHRFGLRLVLAGLACGLTSQSGPGQAPLIVNRLPAKLDTPLETSEPTATRGWVIEVIQGEKPTIPAVRAPSALLLSPLAHIVDRGTSVQLMPPIANVAVRESVQPAPITTAENREPPRSPVTPIHQIIVFEMKPAEPAPKSEVLVFGPASPPLTPIPSVLVFEPAKRPVLEILDIELVRPTVTPNPDILIFEPAQAFLTPIPSIIDFMPAQASLTPIPSIIDFMPARTSLTPIPSIIDFTPARPPLTPIPSVLVFEPAKPPVLELLDFELVKPSVTPTPDILTFEPARPPLTPIPSILVFAPTKPAMVPGFQFNAPPLHDPNFDFDPPPPTPTPTIPVYSWPVRLRDEHALIAASERPYFGDVIAMETSALPEPRRIDNPVSFLTPARSATAEPLVRFDRPKQLTATPPPDAGPSVRFAQPGQLNEAPPDSVEPIPQTPPLPFRHR